MNREWRQGATFSPVHGRMPHGVLAARRPVLPEPTRSGTPPDDNAGADIGARSDGLPTRVTMPYVRTASPNQTHGTHGVGDISPVKMPRGFNQSGASPLHQGFNFTMGPGGATPGAGPGHRRRRSRGSSPQKMTGYSAAPTYGRGRLALPGFGSTSDRGPSGADWSATAGADNLGSSAAQLLRTAKAAPASDDAGADVALKSQAKARARARRRRQRHAVTGGKLRLRKTMAAGSPSARSLQASKSPGRASPERAPPQSRTLRHHLKQSTVTEWLRMYDREHNTYKSTAVEVESRLRRAKAYSSDVSGSPRQPRWLLQYACVVVVSLSPSVPTPLLLPVVAPEPPADCSRV